VKLASDSARKRLAYILSDEFYGPKLARLRGDEERRVLELIDQNRGKQARDAILKYDEKRRERQRLKRPKRALRTREQRESIAVANILRIFGAKANVHSVRRNTGYMTDSELDFAGDASEDALVLKAVGPEDRNDIRGKRINPFWYH